MNGCDFRLLVGLGNPGSKYNKSRHNIGFMALEKLAKEKGVSFKRQKKLYGFLGEINFGNEIIRILLPDTFMNESGKSIRATIDWFNLEAKQVLIILDDMDLPLGKIRLRGKGSSGGHNGLTSIIQHLGTEEFARLRIGIGAPSPIIQERKRLTVSHVLGNFNSEETSLVNDVLNEVLIGLEMMQKLNLVKVCNYLNAYKADIKN